MKKLVFVGLAFVCCLKVYAFEIEADMLKFRYQPNEDAASECSHRLMDPVLNDWHVKCKYYRQVKEFVVHLIVRNYKRQSIPRHSYEVLYWVTNRIPGAKVPEFTGTTLWFNFEKETVPYSIKMGQQVDNSYASLDLEIVL